MASDSSDDEQYETADNSESSDESYQMSFHNELTSSSESSDEVSGHESIRGIFKFGKLSSSKASGKENEEFQDGTAKEERLLGGDDVNLQIQELPSDQTKETGLHSPTIDNSAEFVDGFNGRDLPDCTKDLKKPGIDSCDIKYNSDMKAHENVDVAETLEEKKPLIDSMSSPHMPPCQTRRIEGNAEEIIELEADNTDKTYPIDDSVSISESFVILDSEPTSTLLVYDQMGEIEKASQNATQISLTEGLEQSFEICNESFGESGSINKNIENMMVNPPNSKDTKNVSLSIAGNSEIETYMHLSQPSSEDVHEKSMKKRPPPVAPKPLIKNYKREQNGSMMQSSVILKDEALNKTYEDQFSTEAEQKEMISQARKINNSTHDPSQPLIESNLDNIEQRSQEVMFADDPDERQQTDANVEDMEQIHEDKKDKMMISHFIQHVLTESQAYDTEQRFQENDNDPKPQDDTHTDETQGGIPNDAQIQTTERSPQIDDEERPQRDIKVDYTERCMKVSDMLKLFDTTQVKDTSKDREDEIYNIKSIQSENEPRIHVPEIKPVPKRRGNIVLKPHKQSTSEPRLLNQSNIEQSQMEKSDVPELSLTYENNNDDVQSKSPKQKGVMLHPKTVNNQIITDELKLENPVDEDNKDYGPPTPPPKSITVMESLKQLRSDEKSLESHELSYLPTPLPPPLPPKSLTVMKTHKTEAQPNETSEVTFTQPPPQLPPKRFPDQLTNENPQSMHSSLTGQLHNQEQSQQDRSSLQSQGSEGGVQMSTPTDDQQNLTHGTYFQPNRSTDYRGNSTRYPEHPTIPPYGPWRPPPMPEGLNGPHARFWPPWGAFYPGYGQQFQPGFQQGQFPNMNYGGPSYRPPFIPFQEPSIRQTYKTPEDPNQHHQQEHKLVYVQQNQQQQPRSLVPEDKALDQTKHGEPNRKQEERQKDENKEKKNENSETVKQTAKSRKISKTSEMPKVSSEGNRNEGATSKRDKEKKTKAYPKQSDQDIVKGSPQPAKRKEDHKQGSGIKEAHTSEMIATEPGYTMVVGLSESTSDDNLRNFMEAKTDSELKDIVYGPERENAVVIFERKQDLETLREKISKKPLDGKLLEVFEMPRPVSIVVSTKDPKEFTDDTLAYHFEAKKYGGAELVDDGIKKTEDGCYILTFTDSNAMERVCDIQHKIENIPLIVSPYYQYKEWMAWNTAIHRINIPEPFAHKVDKLLLRFLQSFPRAKKEMEMAMEKMHAGIELQEDVVHVNCLITTKVKGCRKLVMSWRKEAEEKCDMFLSSTFQIDKIAMTLDIWEDMMNIVKSVIKDQEIMLIEEKNQSYLQLIGFCDELKTNHEEIMGKKMKLERIRSIGKESMSIKSAAKKRLLDRSEIFKSLRSQFSDFDVSYEQASDEIILTGVTEDRNNAKLQIFEELKKFDEPVVIAESFAHFSQFIKEGAPRNYIIDKMETKSLIVDWDVNIENCQVSVYCIPAHSAQHAANQMKNMVKETRIPLSSAEQLFVTSEEWSLYQAETESRCQGLVHIIVTNDLTNVIWISMENLHADILEELKDFIQKNTIIEEMIQCNPITKKFVQAYWGPERYKEIEENTGDKHLQLAWEGERLMAKGSVEGIQKAKEFWKQETNKITSKTKTLKRIGVKEVLMSEEHRGILKTLEKKHHCLIQTEDTDQEISRYSKMDDTINESGILETQKQGPYRCPNGLTISLIKGQLAEQKVDVIVCATSPDLNLKNGAASRSLLQRGGQCLQDECQKRYPDKIQEGEVVDIIGGELQCAKVYLTVLPDWRKSNNGQALIDVIEKCLAKAHTDTKSSIAFAAMGTGQLRYPHSDVASLMYDACKQYDSENPQSSVKKVHFILYEKDDESIRAFKKEEQNLLCGGARPKSSVPLEYTVGNVKISQTVGELANQQVDAILCSCAENMVLSQSGACAALLKVGGQTLQDECKTNYPNGITHGQIAIIGGGNLKCKHVLLTALPQYAENGEKVLYDVIQSALQKAAGKGCKSIAISAMGSGYLNYPASLVAKVMHDATEDWAKKNTSSSLTTVKFVLFIKDKSTQSAFQDHVRGTLRRTNTRRGRNFSVHEVKTISGSSSCIIIDPTDDSVCTVGKMKVKVNTGDIITETTDAIVNSVGPDFSFQGGVATLLKQKCPGLEKICEAKVAKLKKSGVVMTKSLGLKCKKIIHVKFQDTLGGWKKIMKKCLEKANDEKLTSISFPVLGTGGGHTSFVADEIAERLFEALLDFDDGHKTLHLQQVNIVVYNKQTQFIPVIKKGMVKISRKGPRGAISRTWDRIKDVGRDMKDMILPRSGLVKHQQTPILSRSQMSQVIIQFYSDSESKIDQCFTDLEKELDKLYSSTPLNDDLIAKMSPKEFEEFFKTDLLVECEFIKEEKQVLIRGTAQNVSRAQNEFQKKLRDKARKENEMKEAEQLYQIVQWQYEEVTSEEIKLIPYDELINLKMEKAFKNNDNYLELPDASNEVVYIIDFKNYCEYVKGDEHDSVKIVRKDILKERLIALPENWAEMKNKENLQRVNVLSPSPEYQKLESIFLQEAKTGPYSNRVPNVQNIKVVKIERIQNKTLYQQYSAKKKSLETKYKDKTNVTIERKVWHGTSSDSIDSICSHGFNRSYCGKHGVWYGHGVYFATNASYSARGWLAAGNQAPPPGTKQCIFYVSVCVGEYIKGTQDMRFLPAKTPSNPTDIYDSAVNDVNNVEEIVIFNDTQAYPDYLITFTS